MRQAERARGRFLDALFPLALVLLCLTGCKNVPEGRDAVDAVRLQGAPRGTEGELATGIATKKSPTLFGIRRIFEYELLDESALERDIQRVERQLRRRGYYEARVEAVRVIRTDENRVRVEIGIEAGDPVLIRKVETKGLASLPFKAAEAATHEMRLRVGDLFDEDRFEQAKQDVANALADRGYAYAQVDGAARVDLANHSATVTLTTKPGKAAELGEIEIVGLNKLDEKPVRRTLKLEPGQPYSRSELNLARSALFGLGAFARVEVLPDLSNPENDVVPVTIRVQESTLRDVMIGGGLRLDVTRFAVTGQAGWTHRNFLKGLRKFSIKTRPGLNFFPTRINNLQFPTAIFPENMLTTRLEQPGFIEGRTKGFAEGGYNVYPLLYALNSETDPKDERVIGYNEVTTALGAERLFFNRILNVSLSGNWQANFPFVYQRPQSEKDDPAYDGQSGLVDGLEEVIVAYPELITGIDLRDNPVQPTSGLHLTNSFQIGLPVLGGDLFDVRFRPQLSTYVPLDHRHKVVLATRATIGMTFPQNYGEALSGADTGTDLDYTNPNVVRDQHNLLFRAFYSGGPSSNRGYPYQQVGPQGTIGFLVPGDTDCTPIAGESTASLATREPACVRTLGGFTMWEASVEVRYKATKNWGVVGFVDASDVSSKIARFTFYEPHISLGSGFRYYSPIGPVRVDLGWRVPGLQTLKENPNEPTDISRIPPYTNCDESVVDGSGALTECTAQRGFLRQLALHILIGESF